MYKISHKNLRNLKNFLFQQKTFFKNYFKKSKSFFFKQTSINFIDKIIINHNIIMVITKDIIYYIKIFIY